MGFFDFMTEDIAIDLGTANTLIIHNDKVVIDSPSIVARDRISGKIIAVGKEANMMQGKTHENIKTIRPLKDGVIADFDASEKMIAEAKEKAKSEYERIVADAQVAITQQKNAALTEVKNQVGSLVVEVAEKVLRRELSNKAEQETYIKQIADGVKLN